MGYRARIVVSLPLLQTLKLGFNLGFYRGFLCFLRYRYLRQHFWGLCSTGPINGFIHIVLSAHGYHFADCVCGQVYSESGCEAEVEVMEAVRSCFSASFHICSKFGWRDVGENPTTIFQNALRNGSSPFGFSSSVSKASWNVWVSM